MIIRLGNDVRAEVISSVLGQLSDGIWENSNGMTKYWKFADVNGTDLDISDEVYSYGYSYYSNPVRNGFYGKSENEIKDWFANKAKQVVKIWAEDYNINPKEIWNRNCTEVVDYMGGHKVPEITVADVYECYDYLKGRSGHKYGAVEMSTRSRNRGYVRASSNDYTEDWKQICRAFAKKIGGELLFVNEDSCGIEFPDGSLRHIYIDELKDYLR